MAPGVLGLRAGLAERDELIAQVDPRHPSPVAAELELQEPPPPLERRVDGLVFARCGRHERAMIDAARRSGIDRSNLRRMLRQLGIAHAAGVG